ncbi:DUF4376 domain-containing protein [Salmonella enterica]|nr:DUF4376 domain-containing protein [Salmonella enterica]
MESVAFITAVRNPRYNESGTISADVQFDGETDSDGTPRYSPFTAAEHDPMEYGRQLYADLKAGKYGPVTPFTVTPEMLTAAKQAKHAEISAWRDAQENSSTTFSLNGHRWDCDKSSQERLGAALEAARSDMLPADFFWTDADNIDVPVNAADLDAMSTAMNKTMFLQGFKIHERQRQMKEEVDKLTTIDEVRKYIPDWPPAPASTAEPEEAGK